MIVHILCEGRTLCTGQPYRPFSPDERWVSFQADELTLKLRVTCSRCWAAAALQWPWRWVDSVNAHHAAFFVGALFELQVEIDRERLLDNRED